jgi:hypothetical protein
MDAGIGLNLGAVERHMAELHQARRPAQLEHLHEQVAQRLEMSPPEGIRPVTAVLPKT